MSIEPSDPLSLKDDSHQFILDCISSKLNMPMAIQNAGVQQQYIFSPSSIATLTPSNSRSSMDTFDTSQVFDIDALMIDMHDPNHFNNTGPITSQQNASMRNAANLLMHDLVAQAHHPLAMPILDYDMSVNHTQEADAIHILSTLEKQLAEANMQPDQPRRSCANCGTTQTPSWRRGLNRDRILCNACGLYLKIHGTDRPFLITERGIVKAPKPHTVKSHTCTNCKVTEAPLWRRGGKGEILCNACGIFYKIHRSPRPVTL